MKQKAFTLIELLVVVAIIGILAAVGVVAYNGYTKSAKNAVIKSNHQKVLETMKADIAQCYLNGGSNAEIDRLVRDTQTTFKIKKFRCKSAFNNELQIHFLGMGLRDPVIQIPAVYTRNQIPNDAGAVYWGVPFKNNSSYPGLNYPAYWVGKTYMLRDHAGSTGHRLKIQAYLMDEKTLLLDYIEIPFN